jgi:hypothetical protein
LEPLEATELWEELYGVMVVVIASWRVCFFG